MSHNARDEVCLVEDLEFLDSVQVGATEAARRTGFPTANAMEKWLDNHGHRDLWRRLAQHDPICCAPAQGQRRRHRTGAAA